MEQAQKTERDADVIRALAKAVEQISRNPRTTDPVPSVNVNITDNREPASDDRNAPQNVSISVSATATATATAENGEDEDPAPASPPQPEPEDKVQQAQDLAEEGRKLREQGQFEEALDKYKEAYALHPIRAYLIIILALENKPDLRSADADTATPCARALMISNPA